ncbi:ROC75 [Auxenochlorella protothecoides x Auxenochlorella symbiontica]
MPARPCSNSPQLHQHERRQPRHQSGVIGRPDRDVSAAAAATMLAFAEMPYSATGQSLHEAGTAGTLAGVKRPNPEPDSGAGAWTPRSPTAPAPDPGGPAAASSAGGVPSGAGGTGLGSAALEHSGTAGSVESGEQGGRKARLVWTQELHNRFINALSHLGLKQAVPKNILTMMNVDGMTRENVASHLQKYRLYLKKIGGFTDRERVDSAALQRIHEQNVAQMAAQQAMQQSLAAGGGMRYGGPSGLPPAAAYGYGGHVGGAADPGPHVARADAVVGQPVSAAMYGLAGPAAGIPPAGPAYAYAAPPSAQGYEGAVTGAVTGAAGGAAFWHPALPVLAGSGPGGAGAAPTREPGGSGGGSPEVEAGPDAGGGQPAHAGLHPGMWPGLWPAWSRGVQFSTAMQEPEWKVGEEAPHGGAYGGAGQVDPGAEAHAAGARELQTGDMVYPGAEEERSP